MREFAPLHDPDWRCPVCRFPSADPSDEERVAWCADCAEERLMYAEDDMELLLEVPTESCLTKEWV